MQDAPPFPATLQAGLISFSCPRGGSLNRTDGIRRGFVTGYGEAGQNALGIEHIQEGFHYRNILSGA